MEQNIFNLNNRDKFIEQNKKFIYNICYSVCNRRLNWDNDDELSIGLIAFNKACDTYKQDKGDFFIYSRVIIRNDLIDFFRRCKNTPYLIFDSEKENIDYIDNKNSMQQFQKSKENNQIIEEIALFSKKLLKYKLKFLSLVENSPIHKDTREKLLNVALNCLKQQNVMKFIKNKRKLPIKQIILLTGEKRKFLEKWRRYILALIIILSDDEFVYIRAYLNIKVSDDH